MLYQQLKDITTSAISEVQRCTVYKHAFIALINEYTSSAAIQFTSLFAQLDFLIAKFNISAKSAYILHKIRKHIHDDIKSLPLQLYETGLDILLEEMGDEVKIWHHNIDQVIEKHKISNEPSSLEINKFIPEMKVYATHIDSVTKQITARTIEEPFEDLVISYGRADRNDDFIPLFNELRENDLLPLLINLVSIEVDNNGIYYPSLFVFEPDYLYDVTAISECFGPFVNEHLGYLVKKFKPMASSGPILIGNTSNYFLDQLIYDPTLNFDDLQKMIFRLDPLGFALKDDNEIREIISKLKNHFVNIKNTVTGKFAQLNITGASSHIEPSFYSAKYGIQGRLDLLNVNDDQINIVELKSGKPYKTNSYGLNNSHYHQTLLYDLLIESAYGYQKKRNNFILYSQSAENSLRYAPGIKAEQREAIKVRNRLMLIDHQLQGPKPFIDQLTEIRHYFGDTIKGYLASDTEKLITTFEKLDEIALRYCNRLIKFINTELRMAKLGSDSSENNGLASLWTDKLSHKIEKFNTLNHLKIVANYCIEDEPFIYLARSEKTAVLSNFRDGDLGVFYPDLGQDRSVLHHQVYKCSVVSISADQIIIRLRSRQQNLASFNNYSYWHIDHDVLENGYNRMSASVFEFALSSKRFQKLILGIERPSTYRTSLHDCSNQLTYEQSAIFNEALSAKDYYLLWGPPGTGKTSIMLRELVHHYACHTTDRILLLAYTNRAVDEICEALLSIHPSPPFIRIGSRFGTADHLHPYLLDEQIKLIDNRKKLNQLLTSQRIFVGTVASILGKESLFQLLKFDICIIDEASQILEASLIGLLSRVSKFILIGDHMQLPAVVQQKENISKVSDELLNELDIINFNNSLFERLYKNAKKKAWHHIIGQLSYQGRMHKELLAFSNTFFYEEKLKPLDGLTRLTNPMLSYCVNNNESTPTLFKNRLCYFDTPIDYDSSSIKINRYEAELVAKIVKSIITKFQETKTPLDGNSIGIITPFRAQIAAINEELASMDIINKSEITVDTVERYQGGARDIIIMSCALNFSFQMKSLCSLSSDGLDRKLNVAYTRAREQFILIGNRDLLFQDKTYKALIERAAILTSAAI